MRNKQRGCLRLAQAAYQEPEETLLPLHPQGFSHIVRLHDLRVTLTVQKVDNIDVYL